MDLVHNWIEMERVADVRETVRRMPGSLGYQL